jgi:hypothetical protein
MIVVSASASSAVSSSSDFTDYQDDYCNKEDQSQQKACIEKEVSLDYVKNRKA